MERKAKDYLGQLKYIKDDMRRCRDQIREMEIRMTSLGAIRYDKDRVSSSPVNTMEESIIRVADAKQKLVEMEAEYLNKYTVIIQQIDGLEKPIQREILKQYYCENRKLYQIADRMRYDVSWVYKNYKHALSDFDRMYLS